MDFILRGEVSGLAADGSHGVLVLLVFHKNTGKGR